MPFAADRPLAFARAMRQNTVTSARSMSSPKDSSARPARSASTEADIVAYTLGELKAHNASIHIAEYDPSWPAIFEREAQRIRSALGDGIVQLEHVGSTSVPGLAAKPRIDILLVVEDSSEEPSYVPALESAGYILRIREPDWYQHRVFNGPDTDLNLHVFSAGCIEIDRMIGFRDWLRTHPEDRALYERTKRDLASRQWKYVQNYADAKTAVVEQTLARAKVASLRSEIRAFLGVRNPEAPRRVDVSSEIRETGFTRRLVAYETSDGETIQAFLFEPDARKRQSAVICLHQHNSEWALGKSEVAGLAGDPFQAFAPALARAGIVVLAPDAIGFESRRGTHGRDNATLAPPSIQGDEWLQYYNHAAHRLVRGELLMTKILADIDCAVSVVQKLADADNVGIVGHSYGGNVALFAAALDTRIAFACSSGAACSFRYKLSHGIGLEMALVIPGFANRFDLADLMRCVAPRRLLVVSSDDDPYAADAEDLVSESMPAFVAAGADQHLQQLRAGRGHALDEGRFAAIIDWLVEQCSR